MLLRKRATLIVVIAFLVHGLPLYAGAHRRGQEETVVPANLKFSLELLSPLSTATNQKGDKFSSSVLSPLEYAGAIVAGHVQKAKRSGKEKGKSEMDLAFESIVLPDGRTGRFNASVVEVFDVVDAGDQGRADNEGTLKGRSSVKRDALKIGLATGVGALIGALVLGGKGAAIGAAIGASIGVTNTLTTKGPDLEFKQGTQFTVQLNAPIHLKPASGNPPSTNVETSDIPVNDRRDPVIELPVTAPAADDPAAPSANYRPYSSANLYRLNVPDNWVDTTDGNTVTFAPAGGMISYQGRPDLTHGVMVGHARLSSQKLPEDTGQFIAAILKNNAYLHQNGGYEPANLAGRAALSVELSGVSVVTGNEEEVTIHTVILRSGELFFVMAVVPQKDQGLYQTAFYDILNNLHFLD